MMENKIARKNRSPGYFVLMLVLLFLVQLLDSYCTNYPNVIPSKIKLEFLSSMPDNVADAILGASVGIATIGTYLVFFNQFLADKFGRKPVLILTVLGMAGASFLLNLSTSIVEYTIYLFLLYVFFSSDLWLIYINEESTPKTRGLWTNVLMAAGIGGPLLLPVFRRIFITDAAANWRGMTWFAIAVGVPLGIVLIFAIKETSRFQELKDSGVPIESPLSLFRRNFKQLFRSSTRREFLILLLMSFFGGLNYSFLSLGENFLKSSPFLGEKEVNNMILVIGVSVIVGYLLTGILADRIGRKPLIIAYSIMLPLSIIFSVAGVLGSWNVFVLATVGFSLAYVAYWGLLSVVRIVTVETIPTGMRGTGAGIRSFMYALGITTGLLAGSLVTLVSSQGISFIVLSLFVFLDVPLTLKYIRETKGIDLSLLEVESSPPALEKGEMAGPESSENGTSEGGTSESGK